MNFAHLIFFKIEIFEFFFLNFSSSDSPRSDFFFCYGSRRTFVEKKIQVSLTRTIYKKVKSIDQLFFGVALWLTEWPFSNIFIL